MTSSRVQLADRAAWRLLVLLTAVAVAVTASAATTLAMLLPAYRTSIENHCTRLAGWLAGHPDALLGLLLIGLVTTVICRSAGRAMQQRAATARLLAGLGTPRALPDRLQHKVQQLGLAGQVDYVAHPVPLSFCYGLRRPRICVSDSLVRLLDDDELTAVLLHERHHARRNDPARLLLTRALSSGVAFLPGVAAVMKSYVAATEVAADAAASADADGRLALAEAMLKLARAQNDMRALSSAPVSPWSPLWVRVEALLSPHPTTPGLRWGTLGQLAVGLGVMAVLAAAPVALAQKPDSAALHPCATEIHRHAGGMEVR